MSNYLGIAIITKALLEVVQGALQDVVPGVSVKAGPPRAPTPGEIEVNIYLYRLEVNAAMRNADLPRDPWGKPGETGRAERLARPTTAVDLHYLISFSGELHLATEVMLGLVLTAFHLRPLISYADILRFARAEGTPPLIGDASIPDQAEPIRLSPEYPTLDEVTKLWSTFLQIAHRPSLFYRASGVLLSAGEPVSLPRVTAVDLTGGES